MPQVINTNVASLNAQRNLNTSQGGLAVSLQRMSSGLRINSAKDDAAGLAIAERFTTQIRGLNQAARNANDGISLSQTAEGALSELTANLQRIRELAVQSANATNSASDRATLDQEVQQRLAEIDRIAAQTSFNGQKILDGSFGNAAFQVGANVGETISVSLSTSMRSTQLGKTADYVNLTTAYSNATYVGQQGTGVDNTTLAGGELTIQVGTGQSIAIGASANGSAAAQRAESAYAKAAAINAAGVGGLTAVADTTVVVAWDDYNDTGYSLTINGQAVKTNYDGSVTALTGTQIAADINGVSSATGVTASYDSATGNVTLNAADGRDIDIIQAIAAGGTANLGLNGTGAGTNNTTNAALDLDTGVGASTTVRAKGTIRLTATDSINVGGTSPAAIGFGVGGSLALGASGLNSAAVTTVANANTTISRVDSALNAVSALRSTFGAVQNRFESTIANLQATSENLTASRSRIQDADFAAETAVLTRNQILQQAGMAMLAQANSLPQNVLALLRG
jgi:flagellin